MPGCMFHDGVFIWRCRPQGFCMSNSFVPVLGRTIQWHLACDAGVGLSVALLQQPFQRGTALLGAPTCHASRTAVALNGGARSDAVQERKGEEGAGEDTAADSSHQGAQAAPLGQIPC